MPTLELHDDEIKKYQERWFNHGLNAAVRELRVWDRMSQGCKIDNESLAEAILRIKLIVRG